MLTSLFELSGKGLGFACRLSPSEFCSNLLTEAIDDAAIQQFNDIIRDIKTAELDNSGISDERQGSNVEDLEDVKETIKYHRNIRSSLPSTGEDILENLSSPKMVLTTGIYNVLNVATKL